MPADCVVYKCDEKFAVDESMATGEANPIKKKPLMHYNDIVLSRETFVFEKSRIVSGNAYALVLDLGNTTKEEFILRGHHRGEFSSELREKQLMIFSLFLCTMIFLIAVLLV